MYLFLTFCTICSFFYFGHVAKKCNTKQYFYYSIIPLCLYSVTYGFRKGWGEDYDVYDDLFLGNSFHSIDNYELLFKYLVLLLRDVSQSSIPLFVFVAAITLFSVIYLLKDFRDNIGLSLSLFYFFTAYQSSNIVRFFIAISLVYISLSFALKKKWKFSLILCLLAVFVHVGILIYIILQFLLLKTEFFLNLKRNFLLYILCSSVPILAMCTNYISKLIYVILSYVNIDGLQIVKYVNEDVIESYILGANWESTMSLFYMVFNYVYEILFIYLGFLLIKKKTNIPLMKFFYQTGVFGILFLNVVSDTEILYRIAIVFIYLSSILSAYIIKYGLKIKADNILYILFILSVLYKSYSSVRNIIGEYNALYIWNQ